MVKVRERAQLRASIYNKPSVVSHSSHRSTHSDDSQTCKSGGQQRIIYALNPGLPLLSSARRCPLTLKVFPLYKSCAADKCTPLYNTDVCLLSPLLSVFYIYECWCLYASTPRVYYLSEFHERDESVDRASGGASLIFHALIGWEYVLW